MLVSVPCGSRGLWAVWGGSSQEPLPAETHRQAVPRVCVLFPPPAGAAVLMVPSVANRRPHGSTTHRAVAAALGVVVGAFHRQLHATVLLVIQMRTGQWIGGCRGDGWGSHMVNSLQRRGSFHASLSARNRGDSEGWRGDGKPGLIVCCHDQCSGSSRLRLAAGYWQGCRQAGHQGGGCL